MSAQARNRIEQAEARRKDHVPDTHLMAKFRDEASMLEQAASICEKSEAYGNGPAVSDDQAQRDAVREATVSTTKKLVDLNPNDDPSLAAQPVKNKGGRPRKFTMKEIEASSQGTPVAVNDRAR